MGGEEEGRWGGGGGWGGGQLQCRGHGDVEGRASGLGTGQGTGASSMSKRWNGRGVAGPGEKACANTYQKRCNKHDNLGGERGMRFARARGQKLACTLQSAGLGCYAIGPHRVPRRGSLGDE